MTLSRQLWGHFTKFALKHSPAQRHNPVPTLSHIVYAVGAAPYQSPLSTDGREVAAKRGIDTAGRRAGTAGTATATSMLY